MDVGANKLNIAIVFAGGTGQRMNTKSRPKQFLEVHGKPILIYTLEHFENHPDINGIVVVCLESWIPYCQELLKKFHIMKVMKIVPGGDSGQESIYHGLITTQKLFPMNSIVLIHDGVRPLINEQTITDCLTCVKKNGNAVTVAPAIETIFLKAKNKNHVGKILNRASCVVAKAPQCFYLKDIWAAHQKAIKENKYDFIDSASMMQYYGQELFIVNGPYENIKVTTPSDFYIFRSLLDAQENLQILGL